jgi:hypothetical protein
MAERRRFRSARTRRSGPASGQVPGRGVALRDPVGGVRRLSSGMSAAPISGSVVGTMVTLDLARTPVRGSGDLRPIRRLVRPGRRRCPMMQLHDGARDRPAKRTSESTVATRNWSRLSCAHAIHATPRCRLTPPSMSASPAGSDPTVLSSKHADGGSGAVTLVAVAALKVPGMTLHRW